MTTTTPKMRPSRVLKKMRAGGMASCTKLNLSDPRAAEIAALSGFDAIWLCREHVPTTWEQMENQIRAAKMHDVDAVVRVTRSSYSELCVPLEMDAAAIMVPHLMSAAEAKQIARQTKFHPIGRRPLDGGNADGRYCTIPQDQYLEQANRERFVIVQIEDPEPLAELDEIAATPGIDMLLFGPGDFTHSCGIPGKFDDPRVQQAREQVVKTAHKHGKFAGTVGGPGDVKRYADMGFQFLSVGADVVALYEYFSKMAGAFGAATSGGAKSVYQGDK